MVLWIKKRGGIAPVLVTTLTSAQLRKVSGMPHPTASVPFSHVPHMFPAGNERQVRSEKFSRVREVSRRNAPCRDRTGVIGPLHHAVRAGDVRRQSHRVSDDALLRRVARNLETNVLRAGHVQGITVHREALQWRRSGCVWREGNDSLSRRIDLFASCRGEVSSRTFVINNCDILIFKY